MKQKLIFLDIDGTLTPAGSNTPPESAMTAVRAAQAKGHKVFLCTGRNPAMLAPVLALGFDGAVAGAGGYVFTNDEVLFDCPMKPEDFDWLAEYTETLAEEGKFAVMIPEDDVIALEDGLWMPASVGIVLGKTENDGCLIESDSFREVLVKIPEP